MKKINVVIPMAGAGSRFTNEGYTLPKPFIDVQGKMMIEHVLENLPQQTEKVFLIVQDIFLQENEKELEHLQSTSAVEIRTVEKLTQGASCTALSVHRDINNDMPVLFLDCDNFFINNVLTDFVDNAHNRKVDGSLLTIETDNPAFSYVELNGENVIRTAEKEVISNQGICGGYYFAKGQDFVDYAINMMIYGDKSKNEFYMSNVYNHMIKNSKNVGYYNIDKSNWIGVGTPIDLMNYINGIKG